MQNVDRKKSAGNNVAIVDFGDNYIPLYGASFPAIFDGGKVVVAAVSDIGDVVHAGTFIKIMVPGNDLQKTRLSEVRSLVDGKTAIEIAQTTRSSSDKNLFAGLNV